MPPEATQNEAERRLLVDKWKLLQDMDIVRDKDAFVFGMSGSLTDTELYTTLKVKITHEPLDNTVSNVEAMSDL